MIPTLGARMVAMIAFTTEGAGGEEGSLWPNYFNSGKQFPILVELRALDARVPLEYTATRYNPVGIMQIKLVHGVSKCTELTANVGWGVFFAARKGRIAFAAAAILLPRTVTRPSKFNRLWD